MKLTSVGFSSLTLPKINEEDEPMSYAICSNNAFLHVNIYAIKIVIPRQHGQRTLIMIGNVGIEGRPDIWPCTLCIELGDMLLLTGTWHLAIDKGEHAQYHISLNK